MNLNLDGTPREHRTLAVGLAVIAAGLLIFAAVSRAWMARPAPVDVGFGPMGCSNCAVIFGEGAGNMSNGAFVDDYRELFDFNAKNASNVFAPAGWATFALCLMSALGLLGAAFLGATKQRRPLPIAPATVALLGLMLSLISAFAFVATKPGGAGFVGISYGFWFYGIGAVMGIVSAQMLAKLTKPVDTELLAEMAMLPD